MKPLISFLAATLWIAATLPATAQDYTERDLKPEQFKKLTLHPSSNEDTVSAGNLYPNRSEMFDRNAAIYYHRARHNFLYVESSLEKQPPTPSTQGGNLYSEWMEGPLDAETQQHIKGWLSYHQRTISELEFARRSRNCDWQILPEENLENWFLMIIDEVQTCRAMARMLAVKARLEIAEGRFDDATHTLQTGFKLSRDVNQSNVVVGSLIAVACSNTLRPALIDLMTQENGPNFKWKLAMLPAEMTDVRPAMAQEIEVIRSGAGFDLITNPNQTRTNAQWREALNQYSQRMEILVQMRGSGFVPVIVVASYPIAKQLLLESGMSDDEVESMSSIQAVALAHDRIMNRTLDEFKRGLVLDIPEGIAYFKRLERKYFDEPSYQRNIVSDIGLIPYVQTLFPATQQVYQASARSMRERAALQVIESIRLHMGKTGSLPKSLDEIDIAGVPNNPETGKPFRYVHSRGSARLFDFGSLRQTATVYELTPARK